MSAIDLLLRALVLAAIVSQAEPYNCSTLEGKNASWSWVHARRSPGPLAFHTGLVLNPELTRSLVEVVSAVSADIPEEFDSRVFWKRCPSIGQIVDQGCCGSCWACASANVMTDRECIHNGEDVEYSVGHIAACSSSNRSKSGCSGGDPLDAFKYWVHRGVVSGGGYNSSKGCLPYAVPPSGELCMHKFMNRPVNMSCVEKCQLAFDQSFDSDRRFGVKVVLIQPNNSEAIQTEILRWGPVVAGMDIFEDFKCYRNGVYENVDGKFVSQHAVRLIGWGVEDGRPYWLAANSWGAGWGDKGFFKIKRNVDECKIESVRVCSALPATTKLDATTEK